jgi:hypothetical protein
VNGELAQLICIATHGSKWLRDDGPPPELEAENSTFQYVAQTIFHLPRRRLVGRAEESTSIAEWLRGRRAAGVDGISLGIAGLPSEPDQHALAAFSNSGGWGLIAHGPRHSEAWHATWTVGDREAPDRRIWMVNYTGTRLAPTLPQQVEVSRADDTLRERLRAAAEFAAEQGLDSWTDWFKRALMTEDVIPYHPDMLPPDYDPTRRRLAAMATQAFVFGGMGSWNDVYYDGADARGRYEAVTRDLYDAVLTALIASVNTSDA